MRRCQKPPAGLAPPGRKLWRRLLNYLSEEREVVLIELLTLDAACRAFDRVAEARELIADEGLIITDPSGRKRPHPAVTIERAALAQLNGLLKLLVAG